jgi:hypothetical protein
VTDKPLLLLDVDGPLNPYAAKPHRRPEGFTTRRLRPTGWTDRKPLRVWLHPDHGRLLLDFTERVGMELVWCTTWEHDANTMIGPVIGLPELPVIEFKFTATEWKFNAVAAYAAGRPLAWLDDDFKLYGRELAWFEQQRGTTPTLLQHVSPRTGITPDDLAAVEAWVAGLPAPASQEGGKQ